MHSIELQKTPGNLAPNEKRKVQNEKHNTTNAAPSKETKPWEFSQLVLLRRETPTPNQQTDARVSACSDEGVASYHKNPKKKIQKTIHVITTNGFEYLTQP